MKMITSDILMNGMTGGVLRTGYISRTCEAIAERKVFMSGEFCTTCFFHGECSNYRFESIKFTDDEYFFEGPRIR